MLSHAAQPQGYLIGSLRDCGVYGLSDTTEPGSADMVAIKRRGDRGTVDQKSFISIYY